MSDPNRIRTDHDVSALVAFDTIELLHARVVNLCGHGRRIATTHRFAHVNMPPDMKVGLTLAGPVRLSRTKDAAEVLVPLQPGIAAGVSFAVHAGDGCDLENDGWRAYHHPDGGQRRNLTEVRIVGGCDGDEPTRNDLIEIRWWNSAAVCIERVVAFDYDTRVRPDRELGRVREELRAYVDKIDLTKPWDDRDMLRRVLAALDTRAADDTPATSGDQRAS